VYYISRHYITKGFGLEMGGVVFDIMICVCVSVCVCVCVCYFVCVFVLLLASVWSDMQN
jgi:hypothetical protein